MYPRQTGLIFPMEFAGKVESEPRSRSGGLLEALGDLRNYGAAAACGGLHGVPGLALIMHSASSGRPL